MSATTAVAPGRLLVPGTDEVVEVERDDGGRLRRLTGGGRTYVDTLPDASTVVDDLLHVIERAAGGALTRTVTAGGRRWTEVHRWDADGRLVHVDGVDVRRDARGRVTACVGAPTDPETAAHRWSYGYTGDHLAAIRGPGRRRDLTVDPGGRLIAVREDGQRHAVDHDAQGVRRDVAPAPVTWHRDAAGRLWCVTDAAGTVLATYLWDGHRCLGRIDGPLGAPLAAAFSLDPSGTPVRVVTRAGVVRVPRDAYGEGLLDHALVPGLFGGAVAGGVVHLPLRRLDPRTGAFCEPDPLAGDAGDPRRVPPHGSGRVRAGGPLPTDVPATGRYACCRHDPVGRTDPTGGVSVPLVLSTFTWSSMNNVVSFIGMDWWFNLLASLFTWNSFGNFFSSESLSSSDRLGSFGLRRDGIISGITGGRAFTTQHIVWTPAHELDELAAGAVIVPSTPFDPGLYGSVVLATPQGEGPRVLRGTREPVGLPVGDRPPSWTRAGGTAVAAVPGAVAPVFPSGGLHLDARWEDRNGPHPTSLGEARAAGPPSVGDLDTRTVLRLPAGATVDVGALVLLSDAADGLAFATVVSSGVVAGERVVRLAEALPGIGPADVRVRSVDPAPLATATLPAAGLADALAAQGPASLGPGDLLRLTDTATGTIAAARVARLEARIPLDRPVPGALATPLLVRATVPGTPVPATRRGVRRIEVTDPAQRPGAGSAVLLRSAGGRLAALVTATPDDVTFEVDADIDPVAGADGDALELVPLTAGAELGTRPDGGVEADPRLTYRPVTAGAAPDASTAPADLPPVVRVDAAAGAAVRIVTGPPVHDAIILDRARPGAGPFTVETRRVTPGGLDRSDLTLTTAAALVLRPAVDPTATPVLRLLRLEADPPVAAVADLLPGATLAGAVVSATIAAGAATPAGPEIGEVVLIGGSEPAVVDRLTVTVGLDRDLGLPGGTGGLSVVLLAEDGFAYDGAVAGADRVRLSGLALQLDAGGAPDPTQPRREVDFPRLGVGETVRVRWSDGGTPAEDVYRVAAVAGTTVTLSGGRAVPAAATDLSVRRLVPADPGTGGALVGRGGELRAGTPPRLRADVWALRGLRPGLTIGIATAEQTLPAVVTDAEREVAVTLTATPSTAAGAVALARPTVLRAAHVTRFVRDGDVLLVTEPLALDVPGRPIGDDTIVAVRMTRSGDVVEGTLSGGTLLVPEEETVEIDRRQSLVDHELVHTLQYAYLGPWWFAFFPLWALELGIEFGTDTDLPEDTPFAQGTWASDPVASNAGTLTLASGAALTLEAGQTVQLVQGSQITTAEVVSTGAAIGLRRTGGPAPADGAVSARRKVGTNAWDVVYSGLQLFTHGGLLNTLVGSTYGSLLYGIGKLFYAGGRAIFGTGDLHPCDVEAAERRTLTLTDDAGRRAFLGDTERLVIVRSGLDTVVRRSTRAGDVLTLDEALPEGWTDVRVAPYATHDPGSAWDWFDYHAARVPDPALPQRIELLGDAPTFGLRDRVELSYRGASKRTTVTAVSGSFLELEESIALQGDERTLRIAKVDEADPLGNADSAAMLRLGMGWMRWFFDPWGQLQQRVGARADTWADVLTRIGRYLFGSQSWSILPLFGYVFYDRILFHSDDFGYRANIEQWASQESGDLYSPLGRLTGEVTDADGFAQRRMVVGDIGRYRYWPNNRDDTFVVGGRQGRPGVHLAVGELRTLPFTAETAGGGAVNGTTEADPAQPAARAVPDLLAAKSAADPDDVPAADPRGFEPAGLGLVPSSASSQRTLSGYVAWTRPGRHRVTTRNGIVSGAEAADLHARGAAGIHPLAFWEQHGLQTLFFDIDVADVDVQIAGQAHTAGEVVELVIGQEAAVQVSPDGARAYALTVIDPGAGAVRSPSALVLAGAAPGEEAVEISRLHAALDGGYASGGLAQAGLHLGGDVHIPVRRLSVRVTDQLPVRGAAEPDAPVVAEVAPDGSAFVLVPAAMATPLRIAAVDGVPPGAGDELPAISVVDPLSASARAFVGPAGAVFRIAAPAAAPAAPRVLRLEVAVTAGATLHAELTWATG